MGIEHGVAGAMSSLGLDGRRTHLLVTGVGPVSACGLAAGENADLDGRTPVATDAAPTTLTAQRAERRQDLHRPISLAVAKYLGGGQQYAAGHRGLATLATQQVAQVDAFVQDGVQVCAVHEHDR
jgi:hypothetical protein